MPDDHSDVVPLLPIPNRTVKRVCADDSADPRVKVGHRQALTASKSPSRKSRAFCFWSYQKHKFVIEKVLARDQQIEFERRNKNPSGKFNSMKI